VAASCQQPQVRHNHVQDQEKDKKERRTGRRGKEKDKEERRTRRGMRGELCGLLPAAGEEERRALTLTLTSNLTLTPTSILVSTHVLHCIV